MHHPEAILAAQTALYEELVHFFRGAGRSDLAKAVETQRRMIDMAVTRIENRDAYRRPALDMRRRSCCICPGHMSAYVYILRCRDGRYYYGSTNDLIRRLALHRAGKVRSTKPRLPVQLVYFEECQTPDQARQRERSLKNGRTRRKTIDLLIGSFPRERLAPFA